MTTDTAISPLQAKFLEVRIIFQKLLGVSLQTGSLQYGKSSWVTELEKGAVIEFEDNLNFYSPDLIYPYPCGREHIIGFRYEPLEFNLSCLGVVNDSCSFDLEGLERILFGLVLKRSFGVYVPIPGCIIHKLEEEMNKIGVEQSDSYMDDIDWYIYGVDKKYREENNLPLM